MRTPWLLLALVACSSSGDQRPSSPPVVVAMAPAPPTAQAAPATPPTIAALNKRAGDSRLSQADRCAAVFELFDKHVAPNASAPAVAAVVLDRSWITVDNPVRVLGGWVPVEMNFDDSVFVVHCNAKPEPRVNNALWSPWVIYGPIAGKAAESFKPFLAATADVKLIEYALVYPDGRIEMYKPTGRKSLHM